MTGSMTPVPTMTETEEREWRVGLAGGRLFPAYRQCPRCHKAKPADTAHFAVQYRYADGHTVLKSWCRDCQRAYAREYWRAKHPPKQQTTEPSEPAPVVELRRCPDCSRWKRLEREHWTTVQRHADGGMTYDEICRPCRERRAEAVH